MQAPNGQVNRYPLCPVPFGRPTFAEAANILMTRHSANKDDYGVIVEFGSTRSMMDMGAGYSTPFLYWLGLQTRRILLSIDNKQNVTEIARKICNDYFPTEPNELASLCVTADAIEFMRKHQLPNDIDLLYLDAYDYDGSDTDKEFSKQKHLELFALCEPHLAENALVMIDDVLNLDTYEGKGQLLIPELLNKGYKMLVKNYCCLLEKPLPRQMIVESQGLMEISEIPIK